MAQADLFHITGARVARLPCALPKRQPRRRSSVQTLADDPNFQRSAWSDSFSDPDLEVGGWPDCIDQTRLGDIMCGRFAYDDAEDDDDDSSIDDEQHDPIEEDGI